ncbi:MAG: glycine--tRNA ligase subunit beta [Veillonellales bacterium]
MPQDLLLEIGTEEIPARFMPGILVQLRSLAAEKLEEGRIQYEAVQTVGTPRRMTLIVREVAGQQADKKSENKGPSVKIAFDDKGAPTKAAHGFARGQGLDVSHLVEKDGYVYAMVHEAGRAVAELLPDLLQDIIHSLSFPKNMRWGSLDMRFVRPIRWLLCLYGRDIVPFTVAGVHTGNTTRGHRFLSKGEIVVQSADDYFTKLAEGHVMVDPEIRRRVIREQVEKIAIGQGGTAAIDEDLLEEIVYLVEYPTALCGRFEEKYLKLPPEAVITPMREHQRYFPVVSKAGKLLPYFITVRNGGADYIDIVRHGNERVLRARLADAQFFFEEDQKVPLAQRVEKLKTIVFQEGLGTLYDKTSRIEKLADRIAEITGADSSLRGIVARGAKLSKTDLVTGMVCEFTELQGVMGREYALLNGEESAVAQAIFEHYLPRFAGDVLPASPAGRAISIADKIDNIVATFSRGLIPSGSQDPYALRRQALGIVNILIDANYHISLSEVIKYAMELLDIREAKQQAGLLEEIQGFFRLRLKNVLADEAVRYDMVDAVMAVGTDDLYDSWLRAKAMKAEGSTPVMEKTVQAFNRAGNLAKNAAADSTVDSSLFTDEAEHVLYNALTAARQSIDDKTREKDYAGVFPVLAGLNAPINAFFAAVMVMDKDEAIRRNRLALLKAIVGLTGKLADLSKIV